MICALAEKPERVKAKFMTKEINEAGIYLINFFINGKETPVIVDEYLPIKSDGSLAFAQSTDRDIWVCLIGKAWAKLHGTYARSESGFPRNVVNHVMGVPAHFKRHKDIENEDEFFDFLEWNFTRKCIMFAASKDKDDKGENEETKNTLNEEGIVYGHSY